MAVLLGCVATGGRVAQGYGDAEVVHVLVMERLTIVRSFLDATKERTLTSNVLETMIDSLAELSGIAAPAPNYLGYLPDDNLKAAFAQWEAWFRRNEGCLHFDTESGELRRGPTCPGTGGERPVSTH